jgi:hypothetical protein
MKNVGFTVPATHPQYLAAHCVAGHANRQIHVFVATIPSPTAKGNVWLWCLLEMWFLIYFAMAKMRGLNIELLCGAMHG